MAIDKELGVKQVTKDQAKEFMIHVKVTMEGGAPVIRVEDEVVDEAGLLAAIRAYTRDEQRKNSLLIEADPEVPRQTIVLIQDKATGARVQHLYRLVPKRGPS
jgi:biopolymer transport protein ExbD